MTRKSFIFMGLAPLFSKLLPAKKVPGPLTPGLGPMRIGTGLSVNGFSAAYSTPKYPTTYQHLNLPIVSSTITVSNTADKYVVYTPDHKDLWLWNTV